MLQQELLSGTEVLARGLRWEVVFSEPAGEQMLFRLRGLDGSLRGHEVDCEQRPACAAFQEAILTLVVPRIRAALKTRAYADVLSFITLLKRSVSTVTAARNTLQTIDATLTERETEGAEAAEARRIHVELPYNLHSQIGIRS